MCGSQARHRFIKSKNFGSSLFTEKESSLVAGILLLPREFGTIFGYSSLSKYNLILELLSKNYFGGTFKISIIQAIYSYSFSPGKRGYPLWSSAKIHPKLHISIASSYAIPKITSGAL